MYYRYVFMNVNQIQTHILYICIIHIICIWSCWYLATVSIWYQVSLPIPCPTCSGTPISGPGFRASRRWAQGIQKVCPQREAVDKKVTGKKNTAVKRLIEEVKQPLFLKPQKEKTKMYRSYLNHLERDAQITWKDIHEWYVQIDKKHGRKAEPLIL